MSQNPRRRHFLGMKSPCGSFPQKVTLPESTPIKLIHVPDKIKNQRFLKKWTLDGNLPIKIQFSWKTNIVRMVQRNNFYKMGLEMSDPNRSYGEKTNFGGVCSVLRTEIRLLRASTKPILIQRTI